MKKLLFGTCFLAFVSTAVIAQSDTSKMMGGKMMTAGTKNCLMMNHGKVMVMKGGMSMPLMKDTTLRHGTMVMMDGMVKMMDGSTYMLKDGESVMPNGKVMKMSDGKM